jgi:hypothetical protein
MLPFNRSSLATAPPFELCAKLPTYWFRRAIAVVHRPRQNRRFVLAEDLRSASTELGQ